MMFTFRMLIKRAYPLAEIHHMATEAGWSGAKIEAALLGFEPGCHGGRPLPRLDLQIGL
jgi:hypothetical protein